MAKRVITLRQAAELLGVHHTTAYRQFRDVAHWGLRGGRRCLLVPVPSVREAALPRLSGDESKAELEERIAKVEGILDLLMNELQKGSELSV